MRHVRCWSGWGRAMADEPLLARADLEPLVYVRKHVPVEAGLTGYDWMCVSHPIIGRVTRIYTTRWTLARLAKAQRERIINMILADPTMQADILRQFTEAATY